MLKAKTFQKRKRRRMGTNPQIKEGYWQEKEGEKALLVADRQRRQKSAAPLCGNRRAFLTLHGSVKKFISNKFVRNVMRILKNTINVVLFSLTAFCLIIYAAMVYEDVKTGIDDIYGWVVPVLFSVLCFCFYIAMRLFKTCPWAAWSLMFAILWFLFSGPFACVKCFT